MCEVTLVDRKNNQELMETLGLKKTFDKMAKVNGTMWYGQCRSSSTLPPSKILSRAPILGFRYKLF